MKNLFIVFIATLSLQAFAGETFYQIRPKLISGGTKGFELKYDAKRKKCVKEFWDGTSGQKAQKDVLLRNCDGFTDAMKYKETKGQCKANNKITDVRTVFGINARKEIVITSDCVCYKLDFATFESLDKSFENISECQDAFGEI